MLFLSGYTLCEVALNYLLLDTYSQSAEIPKQRKIMKETERRKSCTEQNKNKAQPFKSKELEIPPLNLVTHTHPPLPLAGDFLKIKL